MDERQQLEKAIAAQESLRGTLEDSVINAAIATLEDRLTALDPSPQQRKLATILFADIVNSTRLTRGMDPEEQMALIDPLVQRMAARVDDYGGRVCRYQGDGFKAVFGLPVAHENDPAQAIRAGLAIQDESAQIGEELKVECGVECFQVRVGLTTGLVFSGGETEGEDTIKGEAVHLAARLQTAAQPGTVLISHDSYRLVRGVFDVDPLEPIQVKGFSEPVVVYRVQGAKQLSFYRGMRGVEGVETRMVGRELELFQLQKILEDVIEDGAGQMVTVVGGAGLGKSRLLYEFENWGDLLPDRIKLFKGRARLETQGVPYGLLRDLFVFRFGILDDDRAQVVKDKLLNGFGEVFGRGEEGEKKAYIIGQLLGYNFEDSPHLKGVLENPQQLRDQAAMYLAHYFKTIAMQKPVVFLLEDLHWADETSLDAINGLAIELKDHPVSILGTARHGLLERRPHWGEGQDFHRRILLEPLSKRESRKLVAEVLQRVQDVPEALSELVVRNAEGNPFYVEELIKMLVEDGVILREEPHWRVETGRLEDVHVPSTLTGVLQARLDGLTEEERKALQGASVIGRVFWDKILEHINAVTADRITDRQVAEVLDELRSRELIFQRETSAFAEASEHIFKHALLREVTYESVLKRVRQAYHALVAEWLIEHAGDRAGEFTGLIADHLEMAGNDTLAGKYLLQAGKQAAKKYANQEGVRYLSRALNLTAETNQEARYEILRERELVYDVTGNREAQEVDLVALEKLADALDDREKQAETALRRANYADQLCIYQSSLEAAQRAVHIAQEIGNLELEAGGYLAWGRVLWRQYELDEAKPKIEQALELARKIDNQQLVAHALRNLGIVTFEKNDWTLANNYHQECLTLYRKNGDRIGEITTLNNLGNIKLNQLEFELALEYTKITLDLSREIGHKSLEGTALSNLGNFYRHLGADKEAWNSYEQCLQIARQFENPVNILYALGGLAFISVQFNEDNKSARTFAEEGLSLARGTENTLFEETFLYLLAHSFIGLEKWSLAEDMFEKSIGMLISIDHQDLIKYRWDGLARLYLAQGFLDQAAQKIDLILEDMEVTGIKKVDYLILKPMQICCQILRITNDSRFPKVLETTYNHLQNIANKISDKDLWSSFLNNVPWNKGIMEMWEAEHG